MLHSVVRSASIALVAHQLHAADDLADGKKAEQLSSNDATGSQLGITEVAQLLDGRGVLDL